MPVSGCISTSTISNFVSILALHLYGISALFVVFDDCFLLLCQGQCLYIIGVFSASVVISYQCLWFAYLLVSLCIFFCVVCAWEQNVDLCNCAHFSVCLLL